MPEGTEQKKAPSTDIIERLLAKGKKNGGSLLFGELIDALQKQDMSPDEMDDMYQRFSDEGVEIVDDVAAAGTRQTMMAPTRRKRSRSTSPCPRVSHWTTPSVCI